MKFIDKIRQCDDLETLVNKRIKELSRRSINLNYGGKHIGLTKNIVPGKIIYDHNGKPITGDFEDRFIFMWTGFIPSNIAINYSYKKSELYDSYYNLGAYYYVDSYEFLLEFSKLLKSRIDSITNDYELIKMVDEYIKYYFFGFCNREYERKEITQLMVDSKLHFIDHSNSYLSDFKHMNAARCSEFNVMANNILNYLGIYSSYTFGNIAMSYDNETDDRFNYYDPHAYLFAKFDGSFCIMDFSANTYLFNMDVERIDYFPYIEKLINFNNKINKFLDDNQFELIYCDNTTYIKLSDGIYSYNDVGRVYYYGELLSSLEYKKKIDEDNMVSLDDTVRVNKLLKWK